MSSFELLCSKAAIIGFQPCDRWVEIIPQDWLDAGKPDIDYVDQKFKCEVCGGKADKKVRTVSVGQIAQHLPLLTGLPPRS